MSFEPLMKALRDDPALVDELRAAPTPEARDAILDARGIEKPGPDSELPEAGGWDPYPEGQDWIDANYGIPPAGG